MMGVKDSSMMVLAVESRILVESQLLVVLVSFRKLADMTLETSPQLESGSKGSGAERGARKGRRDPSFWKRD